MIVSDYPYAYLYDMEYLPDDAETERFAMDMAALRQASVMIYCLKNKVRNKEPNSLHLMSNMPKGLTILPQRRLNPRQMDYFRGKTQRI